MRLLLQTPYGIEGAAVGAARRMTGTLIGLGIPEYEAKIKGGSSALISVHAAISEAIEKAKEIFERTHAENISSTGKNPSMLKSEYAIPGIH